MNMELKPATLSRADPEGGTVVTVGHLSNYHGVGKEQQREQAEASWRAAEGHAG